VKTIAHSFLFNTLIIVLVLALPLYFIACSGDPVSTEEIEVETETETETEDEAEPALEFGSVTGIVTATNGTTPIQGALVRLKPDGDGNGFSNQIMSNTTQSTPQATTDSEGRYTLEDVPAGDQILVANRGVFWSEIQVTVEANVLTDAPELILVPESKLAYIPGYFDSMEDILKDELGMGIGVHIDEITPADLLSMDVLSEYKMIFINCGSDIYDDLYDEEHYENLREYINSGGLLYISDLEMPILWLLYPEEFGYGEYKSGEAGTVEAEVTFDALAENIGKSNVDIVFNLDDWMGLVEQSIPGNSEILLRGDYMTYDFITDEETLVEDKPLAIFFTQGEGLVIFTSFHNTGAATFDQRAVLSFYIYGFGGTEMQSMLPPIAMQHLSLPMGTKHDFTGKVHRLHPKIAEKLSSATR